jgi:hypothetical protein
MIFKLLNEVFNQIHLEFTAVVLISPTFRQHDIDYLVDGGLSVMEAERLYDNQIKKLNIFLKQLEKFMNIPRAEFVESEVAIHVKALRSLMLGAVEANGENHKIAKSWATTTIREANLAHAIKNGVLFINEFNGKYTPVSPVRNHVSLNGFGGFARPPKIYQPSARVVTIQNDSIPLTGTLKRI